MRRKILFVSHEVEFGGAERSLVDLLQAVDRERYELRLVCSADGPLATAAAAAGVPVHRVEMRHRGRLRKALGLWSAVRALRGMIRTTGSELVHANTLIAGYVGVLAVRRQCTALVWHVRDMSYPWLGRRACRCADAVIANSAATAATLDGVTADVVHNGVDARFFAAGDTSASVRAELGLGPDVRLVAMAGRLDAWKGHRILLEAASRLAEPCPQVHYAIAGGEVFGAGGYRAELEQMAAKLGIAERVHFLGPRDDLPRLLHGVDVLVQPSQRPEPFGRSAAEALAAGVPVIGTDAGGLPEIIEDGVSGHLVPIGEVHGLADRIRELLTDHEQLLAMQRAARQRAEQFTSARHALGVQAVWDRVLERAAARRQA